MCDMYEGMICECIISMMYEWFEQIGPVIIVLYSQNYTRSTDAKKKSSHVPDNVHQAGLHDVHQAGRPQNQEVAYRHTLVWHDTWFCVTLRYIYYN